jgi:hypothetical protein
MHQAHPVSVERKTGERCILFVPRAAVSVCGGIQPGVLARALTPEFLDAGLAARLLMAMPPRQPKTWSEMDVAPDVEQAFHRVLDALLALDFVAGEKTSSGSVGPLTAVAVGESEPHALSLSPAAKAAWVAHFNAWGQEQAAVEGELAAAFSKLEAAAARLALLHHVVGQVARGEDDRVPIEQESVAAGVTLARWFAGEARRVYAILTESTAQREVRRLTEYIQSRGGSITTKELMRSNNRKYPTADEATAALDALVEAGLAQWRERPAGPKGGRPSRVCALCMTHDETDQTPLDGGDDGSRDADETARRNPAPVDENAREPRESEVSSVSSCVMHSTRLSRDGAAAAGVVLSDADGVSSGDAVDEAAWEGG